MNSRTRDGEAPMGRRRGEGREGGRALPGVEGDGEELPHGHGLLSKLPGGDAGGARMVLHGEDKEEEDEWEGEMVRTKKGEEK